MKTGSDLKMALRDAVNCSFVGCTDARETFPIAQSVIEFFCAIGLSDEEYVEILSNCGGSDAETDDAIDCLIEEFKQ